MTKCIQCNKEFEAKRTDAKFCSDTCRKANNRGIKSDKVSEIIKSDIKSDTLKRKEFTLEEVCSPEDLRDFPKMCENRKEAKEAIYVLENNELNDLIKEGVYIPNWRQVRKTYES